MTPILAVRDLEKSFEGFRAVHSISLDIAPGEANDPGLLEQLVPASVPFSLGAGEHKVQDIRIAG